MTTDDTASKKPTRVYRQRDLSAPLDILTPAQKGVIIALARYRYMTVRQLVDCGVSQSATTLRNRILYRLTKRARNNLVQYQDYFAEPANRRLSFVYALTTHGAQKAAELLETDAASVRYPIGGITHVNDYRHREAYIDFCIALDKWAATDESREILTLSHYFDKTGANRKGIPLHSVNRMELADGMGLLEPDGICFLDTGTKRRALAVEIHNTTDTKRVTEQLLRHTHAISAGHITNRLGHDKASFVLSVTLSPEASGHIRKRISAASGFDRFAPLFVFNDLQSIKAAGFGEGWVYANGEPAEIFL